METKNEKRTDSMLPAFISGTEREQLRSSFTNFMELLMPFLAGSPKAMGEVYAVARQELEVQFKSELMGLIGQLVALSRNIGRLYPRDGVKIPGQKPRKRQENVPTVAELTAEMRMLLDYCRDTIGTVTLGSSSGSKPSRFHGLVRMRGTADGNAIRADRTAFGEEETYKKWCIDVVANPKHGYPGGIGKYTRGQVASALSHDSGAHRARRLNTSPRTEG